MEKASLDLIRGTLDLLILKTLTWGTLHGYAIAAAIKQATGDALLVEEGAPIPRSTEWKRRVGSKRSGGSPAITAARSITG